MFGVFFFVGGGGCMVAVVFVYLFGGGASMGVGENSFGGGGLHRPHATGQLRGVWINASIASSVSESQGTISTQISG